MNVKIYTDGSCSGNPGPGGYAARLICNGRSKDVKGYALDTTNNRMELTAILEAVKALRKPCEVEILSDSEYSLRPFINGDIKKWYKSDVWTHKNNKPVVNSDLLKDIVKAMIESKCHFTFVKVEGHSDDALNNAVDAMAREQTELAKKAKVKAA